MKKQKKTTLKQHKQKAKHQPRVISTTIKSKPELSAIKQPYY